MGVCRILEDTALPQFGTVRPRVQIPGPRPVFEYDPGVTARAARPPDHSRITISQIACAQRAVPSPSWTGCLPTISAHWAALSATTGTCPWTRDRTGNEDT